MVQCYLLCFTYILKNYNVDKVHNKITNKTEYCLKKEVVGLRETDISKMSTKKPSGRSEIEHDKKGTSKVVFSGIGKAIFTIFMVFVCAIVAVGISLGVYIFGIASEPTGIDLVAASLNLTSHIYVQNDDGEFKEYQSIYDTENRVWVDFKDIPQHMKDAMVAIEDKRFYEHHGVDWQRTAGAMLSLSSGSSSYGGSTITQQLIKNLTDDNQVSLNRKIREIFRALNVEKEYTKDQILEAYLNVVNFGNNCQGVQAASQLYFGQDIQKCSIAQCAAIAGITQNPSQWNPLIYPENNKKRREIVIKEMYKQGKITKKEYEDAMKESKNMKFVGYNQKKEKEEIYVQNWYIEELMNDLKKDLAKQNDISEDVAQRMISTQGLKIYCAMDAKMQNYIEKVGRSVNTENDVTGLQTAMTLMEYDGRVVATTGSSLKKTSNNLFDRATSAALQPGSSIKPVVVYPYAIEHNVLTYGSLVEDEPLDNYKVGSDGYAEAGPTNWYNGYKGTMSLPDAIEISSNATAAQVMDKITPAAAYKQVTQLMGFTHLDEQDGKEVGALSIGGMTGGVTAREMAAAYQYLGNGGQYYEPYTYYYVTDNDGKIVIDKRDQMPKQAYSDETAAIMNRELHFNVTTSHNTPAYNARIDGWDIIGKTGTTNDDKDSWFCGCSPYATLAVWTGFDTPATNPDTSIAAKNFQTIMSKYLKGKKKKSYNFPADMEEISYCVDSGLLASSYCSNTRTGYYFKDKKPDYCYGDHSGTVYYNNDDTYSNDSYNNNNYTDYNNYTTAYSDNNNYNNYDATTQGATESGGENEPASQENQQTQAPATKAPETKPAENNNNEPVATTGAAN